MSNPLPADKYDPDTLMSWQEWKDAGYFILKGSRSRCRDAVGVCLFSIDQTTAGSEPPKGFGTDIHVTTLNALRAGRALDAHLESVLFKHHPMAYLDDENEGLHF
jgi:hypothetical protein